MSGISTSPNWWITSYTPLTAGASWDSLAGTDSAKATGKTYATLYWSMVASKFGTKYIVTGVLTTPSERQPLPVITAVWQQDTGEIGVRLITAYPT